MLTKIVMSFKIEAVPQKIVSSKEVLNVEQSTEQSGKSRTIWKKSRTLWEGMQALESRLIS